MRKIKIAPGEYYHIYNRGNNKQPIFLDNRDWIRFLFIILYFQSPISFYNLGHYVSYFVKHRVFNAPRDKILENRYVELVSFTLMPNHFHFILHELEGGGISRYMQRVLDSYTKYFNARHGRSGHLFQGPFQIVHISDNSQLLHLSAYIHLNQREIKDWKNKEHNYPWSSYQDYVDQSRWNELLKQNIIMNQFSNKRDYKRFIETSGAKGKIKRHIDEHALIDYAL